MAKKRKTYRTIETDIFGHTVMDKVNSKTKGDNNERVAAKFISEWAGEKFSRVPRSGGLHWKNASIVCGDIACENEDFNFLFVIETKHYEYFASPKLDSGTLPKRNKLETFWRQAVVDADRAKKLPMVLARKNGMKAGSFFVMIDLDLYTEYLQTQKRVLACSIGIFEGRNFVVITSENLITHFPYENFATYINNHYICKQI